MNKFNSFYRKYRFPLLMGTLAVVLLIVLLCYSLIPPKNALTYIDYNDGGNYCDNINAAYDAGIDFESYDNIVKVGELVDNSASEYELNFTSWWYWQNDDLAKTPPTISNNSENILDEKVKFVTGGQDNIKIEYYVMSNIKEKHIVKSLMNIKQFYGKHNVVYIGSWESLGRGSYQANFVEEIRMVFSVYSDANIKKHNYNAANFGYYSSAIETKYDKLKFDYFVTITTKEGVTAKAIEIPDSVPPPRD